MGASKKNFFLPFFFFFTKLKKTTTFLLKYQIREICKQISILVSLIEYSPSPSSLLLQVQELYSSLEEKCSVLKSVVEEMEKISSRKKKAKVHKKRERKRRLGMLCKNCGTTGFFF